MVYPDVTFNYGVVLNDSGYDYLATTPPNLYATTDFHPLAIGVAGEYVTGEITALFNQPVNNVSLDIINGYGAATFTVYAYSGAFVGDLGNVAIALAGYGSAGDVETVSLPFSGIESFLVVSTQTAGYKDFAIDTVNYSIVPLPPAVLLLSSGLMGLVGWRRFRK